MGGKGVIVYIEYGDDGAILPVSLECLRSGRLLADFYKCPLEALVIGRGTGGVAEELRYYSLDRIRFADDARLEFYHPDYYTAIMLKVCADTSPRAILMGGTLQALDFAPRIAFSLHTGLVTDCVGIRVQGETLLFDKPVFSSNVMASYTIDTEPRMATVRPRSGEPAARNDTPRGELEPAGLDLDTVRPTMEVVDRVITGKEGARLDRADVIVAGGRGMGGPEGFAVLSELAGVLGGAVGASRPPCDLEWVNPDAQIGQTGAIVGPSLYVAVGISGSTQHVAGMASSKTVVAINRDEKANIFDIADYGIVGDYREIVPALTSALRALKKTGS